ncbi:MAG: hypothetical protein JJU33_03860 [Phycisphaerales bacterium]|nr:hypothetical protein [Phycisphaerales bacterium]
MRPTTLIACLCLAAPAALAADRHHNSGSEALRAAEPVNTMCPVSKEPIAPSAGTAEHKGRTIGFCCPGCGRAFLAWDESRKDEFVAETLAGHASGTKHAGHAGEPPAQEGAEAWTDPYPLDTCPISGQKLGSMGDPVVKKYDGREVRFCCAACIDAFEADLVASWKKVDEAMIEDQLRYYPMDVCVVSGEPLVEDTAKNIVYGNRLVRLCGQACEREFTADPKKFIDKLDKATADAQRRDYPLDTCVVAGAKLGSMGEPTEMVIAGRLLRFCCAGCEPRAKAEPSGFIAEIDKAWQAKGRFIPDADEPREAGR